MAINYVKLAAKAQKLITDGGRTITLVRQNETPIDAAKPWNGSIPAPETTLNVPAMQLLPNAVRVFGLSALGDASKLDGLLSVSEYVYILFQGEIDLHQFTFVRDGGIDFNIEATQALKPANTTLLGFIGVRR